MRDIRYLLTLGGALLCLLHQRAAAQRLSGLPELTFNTGDSGRPAPAFNWGNQTFTPMPGGGLHVSNQGCIYVTGWADGLTHYYHTGNYFDADLGVHRFGNTPYFPPYENGVLMEASPGRRYFAVEGNGQYDGPPADYVRVSRNLFNERDPLVRPHNTIAFSKPFRGRTNVGVVEIGADKLNFWITSNGMDTTGPHTKTTLILLDTVGRDLGSRVVLQGFLGEKSAQYQGNIYILGRRLNGAGAPDSTQIRAFNGTTLAEIPNVFAGLGRVLVGPAQVFTIDANGKALIAGLMDRPSVGQFYQAARFLPDGTVDGGYAVSALNTQTGTRFFLDSLGKLRAAGVNTGNGIGGTAVMVEIAANGGLVNQTNQPVPQDMPAVRVVMYHPYYDAYLFETGPIFAGIASNTSTDSLYPKKHRFYIGRNGQTWPLVNRGSVGLHTEDITIAVNKTANKLALSGWFTQVNKQLMPGVAIMNADGTLDASFKGLHTLSPRLRNLFLASNQTLRANITNGGKVLLNWPYNQNRPEGDTTHRLLANGHPDGSYQGVFSRNGLLAYPDARKYVGMRLTLPSTGEPVYQSDSRPVTASLFELDAEGNFIREYGSYTPTGYPDTLGLASGRTRVLSVIDNKQGVWVQHLFTYFINPQPGNPFNYITKSYHVRFDSNGTIRIINPDKYVFVEDSRPSITRIEILAGKRMRITGIMALLDTTALHRYVNIIETDSTGKLDMAVPPVVCYMPDAYGSRSVRYATPIEVLPDGKILANISPQYSAVGYIVRYFADGRLDPTFLPVEIKTYNVNSAVLGDRLYLGGQDVRPTTLFTGNTRYNFGNAPKTTLAAFKLNVRPSNKGYVLGRVEQVVSPATGCTPTGVRRAARGMLIMGQPGNHLAMADSGGNYTLVMDTGRATISQKIENNFLQRQVCPAAAAPRTAVLAGNGAAVIGQDFINQTYDCPRLSLQAYQTRFRLCARGVMYLRYENDGTADEPAARVRLNLPAEIRILSSSHTFTQDADSTYVFDLGRLRPGAMGEIVIVDTVGCPTSAPDSLARACFSARIEPLSLCSRIDAGSISWDGAWLDASAKYNQGQDKVRVVIYNRGTAMADSTPAQLLSNGYSYLSGKIKLAANDSLVLLVPPAIQGSIYLAVTQTANCPLGSASTLSHSGRGSARAFLNFGSGLLETYTVQGCPSYRYSFDPNDKTVEPQGEVQPGTELAYTIYFENYGNDTAYAVSVEDSLADELDVNTLKLGASSHPCQVVIEGTAAQPVLYFNFNPIKLTGKKQDSVLSKGQLSFSIRTKASVARGSIIRNHANIYFDRNAAVVTPSTKTPIAALAAVTAVRQVQAGKQTSIGLYPNPAQGSCQVVLHNSSIGGADTKPTLLKLLSPDGRTIMQRQVLVGTMLDLHNLAAGIYTVLAEGYKAERLIIVR